MRGVKPLAPRPEATSAAHKPVEKPAPAPRRPAAPPGPGSARLPPLTADRAAGYDRANAERLKRGQHPVEARLDLHGLTQAEAHRALAAFLQSARASGKRCVLVITGRGSAGGGVLKTAVPRWLDEPAFRPHVLAIATAQPRDGGSGALYVMLRRTRSS
ncbi:MAG TPA: Smr/MutS family protein [Stellaceae bacterium]|jgi:DNA-nicking Smr family endonuclease|nr:Smr/MutS family protein [Stellaceae bacterium]